MYWYSKYLPVFEKPVEEVPNSVIREIKEKFKKFETQEEPVATISIIAQNEEDHIISCLWSLADNVCDYPIEILAIDNHSTDRTGEIMKSAGLKYFDEEKKSLGYARQCGLTHSRGKYHLCMDGDTLYPPHFIQTYIETLKKPGIIAVSSLWSFVPDKDHSFSSIKTYEFLRNIHLRLLFHKRPELVIRGMVFGFDTKEGKKIGFRTNIKRGEDGAMAVGLKKLGKIKLLKGSKTRVVTCLRTLNSDGSLQKNFYIRTKKALKGFKKYFTSKEDYEDQESNKIKK